MADQWQPIATAPRAGDNGRIPPRILVDHDGRVVIVFFDGEGWLIDGRIGNRRADYANPTVWMPLPRLPEAHHG